MNKKLAAARWRVLKAVDGACIARGEAQWLNGYRTAGTLATEEALLQREQEKWKVCGPAEERVKRALAAYVRAVRAETPAKFSEGGRKCLI